MLQSSTNSSATLVVAAALAALTLLCAPAAAQPPRGLPGETIDPPTGGRGEVLDPIEYDWDGRQMPAMWWPGQFSSWGQKAMEWPLMMFSRVGERGRHRDRGDPLYGTSWMNRPHYFSLFTGGTFGDNLISQRVERRGGFLYGLRLGTEIDYYWGVEARAAYSELDLSFTQAPSVASSSEDLFVDVNLLFYPWGDSRWRPYGSVGLGLARFEFRDEQNRVIDDALFHLPLGIGLKHYFRNWLSLRVEFQDNIAFGSRELSTMHNFSITGGVEMRFGGRRRLYWPYNPGIRPR